MPHDTDLRVTDIATKAKINRGTFYTHYEDKFDLFAQYREEFMSKVASLFKQNSIAMVTEAKQHQSTHRPAPSFITKVIELLDENSRFLKVVLNTQENEWFLWDMENFVCEKLCGDNAILDEEKSLVPHSYLVTYIVNAFMGVIRKWLHDGREETPEEIAQILSIINLKGVFSVAGSQVYGK